MNFDKIKKANDDLAKLPTITDKLNHWKNDYLKKYPEDVLWNYFEMKSASEQKKPLGDAIQGKTFRIPINESFLIPELHTPHPKKSKERIEYYHWMLFFFAEERFKHFTKPALLEKYSTPLGKAKLQGRINKITQIQKNAEKVLADGTIEIRFKQHPTDEELYLWYADNLYLRVEVPISSMENPYVVSVCEHKFVLPFLKELQRENKKEIKKTELFRLIGIDNKRLVAELIKKKYIVEDDVSRMLNWLNGILPAEPIHINKPMNHFASLIADLNEAGFIKNSKTFCKKLILASLLFDNETKSAGSIKNALNENASTRIHRTDLENYIDIKDFIPKK